MYDAIVVGARCAGSPTAMLLARQGYVCCCSIEPAFPATPCRPTTSISRVWPRSAVGVCSIASSIRAARPLGAGRSTSGRSPWPAFPRSQTRAASTTVLGGLCWTRSLLEQPLRQAPNCARTSACRSSSGTAITWSASAAEAVAVRPSPSVPVSSLARTACARSSRAASRRRSSTSARASPAATTAIGVASGGRPRAVSAPGNAVIVMPTHDQQTCVVVQWPVAAAAAVRADVEGSFLQVLEDCTPSVAERVRVGHRVERFSGSADLPFFYRQPHGAGWALVGDAGYHKDPGTGPGDQRRLSRRGTPRPALDSGFSGREPLDAALETYTARREAASRPMYELTYKLTQLLPPSADEQRLFGVIGNEADTTAFFGALAGTVPIPSFFAPENIGRIVGAALSRAA